MTGDPGPHPAALALRIRHALTRRRTYLGPVEGSAHTALTQQAPCRVFETQGA
jgi:hypothetical protein